MSEKSMYEEVGREVDRQLGILQAHGCVPNNAAGGDVKGVFDNVKNTVQRVVEGLRTKGVPWMNLLPALGQILTLVLAGTPYGAILAAIMGILFPPAPVPTPTPTPTPPAA